jgi:seryl-tRNA(Sec) selenium transferase
MVISAILIMQDADKNNNESVSGQGFLIKGVNTRILQMYSIGGVRVVHGKECSR